MKLLLQPSLARRLVIALCLAFALVWLILVLRDYAEFKRLVSGHAGLKVAAQALFDNLPAADAGTVRAVVKASEDQYNAIRGDSPELELDDLLFYLENHNGEVIYASPAIPDLATVAQGEVRDEVRLLGRDYWIVEVVDANKRLLVLEPVLSDAVVLMVLGWSLVTPMLIAFPIVLFPIWYAIHRGLAPLRRLVEAVGHRSPDDFSPLSIRLPYRELAPLLDAFNALLSRSRAGLERERTFVQDAAHELRTPLAVINAQAHNLSRAEDPQSLRQAQQAVEKAVERASHLVEQLLTLARLENQQAHQTKPLNIVEFLRDLMIQMHPLAEATHIDLSLESPEHLMASVEPLALHSICSNLIGNAIHYCPHRSHVLVTLEATANTLRFSFQDDGPGIAADDLPHIFERFYRGREHEVSGSGLGLAIVERAVERLGGDIQHQLPKSGKGTLFVVTLPRTPIPD